MSAPDFARPPAWTKDALCAQVDADLFYPDAGGSSRAAKAICGRCDVRAECLDYALQMNEWFGIWGGLSDHERRRMRKVAA